MMTIKKTNAKFAGSTFALNQLCVEKGCVGSYQTCQNRYFDYR